MSKVYILPLSPIMPNKPGLPEIPLPPIVEKKKIIIRFKTCF